MGFCGFSGARVSAPAALREFEGAFGTFSSGGLSQVLRVRTPALRNCCWGVRPICDGWDVKIIDGIVSTQINYFSPKMKRAAQSDVWKGTEAVFHKFLRTFGLLRPIMDPYFGRFGISGPQWGVLRVLQRAEAAGEPALRLRDIGDRLFVQPPSVTTIVDRLERQGLVKRMGSKADLRVRRVRLTPDARKLMATVLVGHADKIKSLFSPLSAQEMDQLLDLLTKLHAHLQTLVPRQGTPLVKRKHATLTNRKSV